MHRRTWTAVAVGLALACTVTACSSGGGSATKAGSAGTAGSAKARTLTVWYMDGDLSDKAVAAINAAFTKATGAQVKVQIQEWDNINTKLTTALAGDNPPDVLEIGNTDVPMFAAGGGLTDITSQVPDMSAGQTWLPGLIGPATVDSKVYAAPLFAGNRAVVYNKTIWAKAGVTAPPTSFAEFTADLDKVKAANHAADFSAINMPGKYWYSALPFVWDAGGQIAVNSGGKWTGALDSPAAQQGLQAWKTFQNTYSAASSRDVNDRTPDQNALFASGKTSAIVVTSINTAVKDNPAIKDQIGTFPFPSTTPGKTQPVFLGGSDLAVAAKSKNQDLGLAYLKAATSTAVQTSAIVGIDGWTPASTQLLDQTVSSLPPTSQAFFTAAKNSVATPATPGWGTIEADDSINSFLADIATGRKSPAAAAKAFDAHLDQALNATQ
ncbi:extracellular solute-binding protein [Streptacidiphilus sp. N1-12]|uniref:Extracellular solute-binding protein n=2 Tax=Streptacidiphilus alkalitolerans TaxID=3342712 RepID=A0ABV6V2Z5_9ACTN